MSADSLHHLFKRGCSLGPSLERYVEDVLEPRYPGGKGQLTLPESVAFLGHVELELARTAGRDGGDARNLLKEPGRRTMTLPLSDDEYRSTVLQLLLSDMTFYILQGYDLGSWPPSLLLDGEMLPEVDVDKMARALGILFRSPRS